MECFISFFKNFISISVFFQRHWRFTGQHGKGVDHLFIFLLLLSTTSARSRALKHLFATLHMRRLSCIFNHTACNYQTATWWDLPPYQVTIWLIDDEMLISVCLLDVILLGFLLQQFETGNRLIWNRIDYHSCTTNQPINQVR